MMMMDMSDVSIDTRRSWNNSHSRRSLGHDSSIDDRSTASGVSDLARVAIEAAKEGLAVTLGINADGVPTLTLGAGSSAAAAQAPPTTSNSKIPRVIKSCMKDLSQRSNDDTCTTLSESMSSVHLDSSQSDNLHLSPTNSSSSSSTTIPTTLTLKKNDSGNHARHQRSLPVVCEYGETMQNSSSSSISTSGSTLRAGRRPRRSQSRRLSDLTNNEEDTNSTDGVIGGEVRPTRRRSRSRTRVVSSDNNKTRKSRSKSGTRRVSSSVTATPKKIERPTPGLNDTQSSQKSIVSSVTTSSRRSRDDPDIKTAQTTQRRRSSSQPRLSRSSRAEADDNHGRSGRRRSRSTSNQSRVKDMVDDTENTNERPRRRSRSRSTSNQSRVKEMGVAENNERRRRRSSSQSRVPGSSSSNKPTKERRRRGTSVQNRLVGSTAQDIRRRSSISEARPVDVDENTTDSDANEMNRRSSAPANAQSIEMSFLKSLEKPMIPKLEPYEGKRVMIDESKNTEASHHPRDAHESLLDRRARRHSNRLRHSRRLLAAAAAAVEKSQLQQVLLQNDPDEVLVTSTNKKKKRAKTPDYLPDFDWASHRHNLEVNPDDVDHNNVPSEQRPQSPIHSESEIEKVKSRINSGSAAGKDLIRRMIRSTQMLVRGSDQENGGNYFVTGGSGSR